MRPLARREALLPAVVSAALAGALSCAHPAPAGPHPPSFTDTFDALIRQGCYLCFREVVSRYRELPPQVGRRPDLRDRAARAALLLLLRRHELGLPPDAEETAARDLVTSEAAGSAQLAVGLRVLDVLPLNVRGIGEDAADAMFHRWPSEEEQEALRQALAAQWEASGLDAYLYLSVICQFGNPTDVSGIRERFPESPLVLYRVATCHDWDVSALRTLAAAEPRFAEISYALGMVEIEEQRTSDAASDLDAAWDRIPNLTIARLAGAELALHLEDYGRALGRIDDLLGVVPQHRRARLVRLQALTYLQRHDEAIALARELASGSWYLGDVYYLLAWNEYQTSRIEAALADVQHATSYESSARVHTLEGLVRIEQARWNEARDAFTTALGLDNRACDAAFYLGHAQARLAVPEASAQAFESAARCYGAEARRIQDQIDQVTGTDAEAAGRRERLERKRNDAARRQRTSQELAVSVRRSP
jgi:tetratricopeptide (TPR) repeat protein